MTSEFRGQLPGESLASGTAAGGRHALVHTQPRTRDYRRPGDGLDHSDGPRIRGRTAPGRQRGVRQPSVRQPSVRQSGARIARASGSIGGKRVRAGPPAAVRPPQDEDGPQVRADPRARRRGIQRESRPRAAWPRSGPAGRRRCPDGPGADHGARHLFGHHPARPPCTRAQPRSASGTDTFTLTLTSSTDLLLIRVLDAAGNSLNFTVTAPDNSAVTCQQPSFNQIPQCATSQAGVYTLQVQNGGASYTLAYRALSDASCTAANPSFATSALTATLAAGGVGACYTLAMTAGQVLHANSTSAQQDLLVTVYDSTGTQICFDDQGDCALTGTGPYFVLADAVSAERDYLRPRAEQPHRSAGLHRDGAAGLRERPGH